MTEADLNAMAQGSKLVEPLVPGLLVEVRRNKEDRRGFSWTMLVVYQTPTIEQLRSGPVLEQGRSYTARGMITRIRAARSRHFARLHPAGPAVEPPTHAPARRYELLMQMHEAAERISGTHHATRALLAAYPQQTQALINALVEGLTDVAWSNLQLPRA